MAFDAEVYILICVFLILTILSLVVNGCTLLGLGRSNDLSWEPRYALLKNLILSDIVQTMNLGPFVTHCLIQRSTMTFNSWCVIQYFTGSACIFCTMITITCMAIERYLYVCHAIHYLAILTPVRLRLAVSFTWVLSISAGLVNVTLLHRGEGEYGAATYGLTCEPDTVERHMGFPRAAAVTPKLMGVSVTVLCLLSYFFAYVRMYQDACNAVMPFSVVNMRARNTVLFYCGMLFLQLLPMFLKITSDVLWELEGTTDTSTVPPKNLFGADSLLLAGTLHVALLALILVPPCINPLIYGLRNGEVRQALPRLFRWKGDSPVLDVETTEGLSHAGGLSEGGERYGNGAHVKPFEERDEERTDVGKCTIVSNDVVRSTNTDYSMN
ncbi:olfactory receptor-like protein OLF4 [Esox lucius]|uniref:olfactory receptor-like protein OLF4 n=1 Tax=Esox lucius TaxID=8010 RepID=UPI001476FA44|nr:olfactory receptor-like protein OLF4 [Esox lucius]